MSYKFSEKAPVNKVKPGKKLIGPFRNCLGIFSLNKDDSLRELANYQYQDIVPFFIEEQG